MNKNMLFLTTIVFGLGLFFVFLNRSDQGQKSSKTLEVSGDPDAQEIGKTKLSSKVENLEEKSVSAPPSEVQSPNSTQNETKADSSNTAATVPSETSTVAVQKTENSSDKEGIFGDQIKPDMSPADVRKELKKIAPESVEAVFENLEGTKELQGSSALIQGMFQGDLTQFNDKGAVSKVDRLSLQADLKEKTDGPITGSIRYNVLSNDGEPLVDSFYEAEGIVRKSPNESNIFFLQVNPQVIWQLVVHSDESHLYVNQFQSGRLTSIGRLVRIK